MSELNRNLASKYSRWGPYQYYQIIVSSVNVNQGIKRIKSHEYGYGGIAQIFLKLIAEKLMVFRGKMCAKMAKEWFHRKRAHIFLFFGTVFSKTRPPEIGGIHMLFRDKNLKHRGGFH